MTDLDAIIQNALRAYEKGFASGNEEEITLARRMATGALARIVGEMHYSGEEKVCEVGLDNWNTEDEKAESGNYSSTPAGKLTVYRTAYGLLIDATPPGSTEAHGINIEFDRDAVAVRLYSPGIDDVLTNIHIDHRGAHMMSDIGRENHGHPSAVRFEPTAGMVHTRFDWTPEAAPAAISAL